MADSPTFGRHAHASVQSGHDRAPAGTDADYFLLSFAKELDASLLQMPGGGLGLTWLDGRNNSSFGALSWMFYGNLFLHWYAGLLSP